MTADVFDESTYEKQQLVNNNLVKAGDPVYKLCTSEEWSIIIKEDDPEKVQQLVDLEYVKVRFIKNQYESWGKVTTYTNPDGDSFVKLTFNNSMVTFCRDRFLNVELITEDESGLKIPNSSIVNKSFYLIPKSYLIRNNDNSTGVLKVKYDEQGNETSEFVNVSVYSENDTQYYLDTDILRSGDQLILTDSNQRYTISQMDTLIGVYNINKGYADFREISILYKNDEYAIVKSNTIYGLNVYDYIVLDSSTIDDNNVTNGIDNGDTQENAEQAVEENADEAVEEETPAATEDDAQESENAGEEPEETPKSQETETSDELTNT